MLRTTTALALLAALAACETSSGASGQAYWGKAGVSMVDYRVDSAQCVIQASGAQNNATVASGQNANLPDRGYSSGGNSGTSGNSGMNSGGGGLTPGGGAVTYSGTAPEGEVNQAALEQRAQEMRARRAQVDSFGACMSGRGYRPFRLTSDQAAHLATLPEGSEERRQYLYTLGADPNILAHQGS
ncbi:MAG: hypothetical protein ABUL73_03240 [Alphaproteobacteria bacterium]